MSNLPEQYIKRIEEARVYDVSHKTRLHAAPVLSKRIGNTVLLKREDEQPIFSFKCRGAFNRIYKLIQHTPVKGVIAASAGNHAQGVALAARELALDAIIVMPQTTPGIKVDAVRALGATAELYGDDFNAALTYALELSEKNGYAFIHPFDDPDTIAGQGTVGMELCEQHTGALDAVFMPIGGGGLAAGVSAYMKHHRPDVKMIGVEPVDAACMYEAIRADERVTLDQVGLFADGVAVRQAGEKTFAVCRETLDEIILITVDEMSAAIRDIFNETRTLTEPAGALAVAGLKKYVARDAITNQTLIAINSGANVNFDRLRHIAERAEIGETREALLAVTIPERPGSFREFCTMLGKRSVTEFNYRYSDDTLAEVFVGVELGGGVAEREKLINELEARDYQAMDMTDNEMAKLHIRHMIGGRAGSLENEQLYRFRFPERPGALLTFLNQIGDQRNITLFHYRNHGAAYGRVLVGLQIPENERESFNKAIDDLGFFYSNESENQAYARFLR